MEENHETKPAPVYSAYGISRRNPLLWLAVLFAVLSFAARIVCISVPDTGAERIGSALYTVIAMILSGLACLWFALELVFEGGERLFKTAKGVTVTLFFRLHLWYNAFGMEVPEQ